MEITLFSIFPYAVLFISLVISYTIYIKNTTAGRISPGNLPPGSLGLPFVGESLQFLSLGRKGVPEKFIYDRMARFSQLVFKTSLFGEKAMVICGAPGNKFLFTNENKLVTPWWPSSIDKLFPSPEDELSVNEESKKLHTIFQTVFRPESFTKYTRSMDLIAQRHFALSWDGETEVQVFRQAKRYTFWLATSMFLSIDDPEEIEKLAAPFDVLASGVLSIPIDLPGTTFHSAVKASKTIRKQLQDIIKQRRILLSEGKAGPFAGDILSHMILFEDDNGRRMSDENIANKILSLLIGGHDTASAAITFIVKYLAEYPDVYDAVYNEQMEIMKSKAPGELLDWDDLQKLKYSWSVACEVMRLDPPLPGAFRQAIQDFAYAGFSVPKGWKIYWSAHSSHRNPEYFPQPEKFDPSRFQSTGGRMPYTFIPFGGGPRMCPGKEYARLEMLVFMHNVVRRFKWEKLLPNEKIVVDPLPTPANGLPIRLHPHKY